MLQFYALKFDTFKHYMYLTDIMMYDSDKFDGYVYEDISKFDYNYKITRYFIQKIKKQTYYYEYRKIG